MTGYRRKPKKLSAASKQLEKWASANGVPFRSIFEIEKQKELMAAKVDFGYETLKVDYVRPAEKAKYTPDIVLTNGICLELKGGTFSVDDRKKAVNVQLSNPDLDIRFVFKTPNRHLTARKARKTNKGHTYRTWCESKGFKVSSTSKIPKSWLQE